MALLPSTNFVSMATGEVMAQFNYFARPIIIYKQLSQTIVDEPQDPLFGYSPVSQSDNSQVTLAEESQTFSGLMIYPFKNKGGTNPNFDTKIVLDPNATYVKILPSVFTYINNGIKTEKIVADGITWNVGDKIQPANYLGLLFYYQELKATN
jgi:hypothetical protein